MDEDRALDALRAGDEDALAWFIERYTAYVSTIVKNMLLPRLPEADAEEAVCDVFLALWRGAGGHTRRERARVARRHGPEQGEGHAAARPRGAPARGRRAHAPLPRPRRNPHRARAARTDAPGRWDSMPEPDREIFLRHYFYCQGVAGIALALDMNVNTVKTRLRRGRESLRRALTKGDE